MIGRWNPNSVTVTHIPSGVSATCNERRTQHRNRAAAMSMLKARMWASENIEKPSNVIATYRLDESNPYPENINEYRRDL